MKLSKIVKKYGDVEVSEFNEVGDRVEFKFTKQTVPTSLEKDVLKKVLEAGYQWIARDFYDNVYIYEEKPNKDDTHHKIEVNGGKYAVLPDYLGYLPAITYDKSPVNISNFIHEVEDVKLTKDEISELKRLRKNNYTHITKASNGVIWIYNKHLSRDCYGNFILYVTFTDCGYDNLNEKEIYEIDTLLEENKNG